MPLVLQFIKGDIKSRYLEEDLFLVSFHEKQSKTKRDGSFIPQKVSVLHEVEMHSLCLKRLTKKLDKI